MIINKLLSILTIMVCVPSIALAGVGEHMESFWEDMGGNTNITNSSSFKGQQAGYYSMGNLHARNKVMNTNLVNVQLPSYRAGCGGIDLFAGSFSFINSDQLVALGKSIASNSVSFAFQLALSTISPQIEGIVNKMQEIAQAANNLNINSCESAASLVGGAWPESDEASKLVCATMGNRRGVFSDYAAAKHGCGTGGQRASVNKGKDGEYDAILLDDVNLAWKAIKDSKILGSIDNGNRDIAELFMTLTGTLIIKAPANDESRPDFKYISGKASSPDTITTMLDGGDMKIHKCDELEKCLNVVEDGSTQTITQDQAYQAKIQLMIEEIAKKIKDDEALTEAQLSLLNSTTIPLYKMLNVHAAYSGASDLFEIPAYAEIVALDLLYVYLDGILSQMETASNALSLATNQNDIDKFRENLRVARTELYKRELKNNNKLQTVLSMVERTSMIENILANKLGASISDTLRWTKSIK